MSDIQISVSEIMEFKHDPKRWWMKYIDRRSPRRRIVPLLTGTLWHRFLELRARRVDTPDALNHVGADFTAEWNNLTDNGAIESAKKLEKDWEILKAAAEVWVDSPPVETISVEKAYGRRFPRNFGDETVGDVYYQIVGTPDRYVRYGIGIWHVQNRTLSPSTTMDLYLHCAPRHLHELMYAWIAEEAFPGERFVGTMFDILRKLSPKSILEKPSQAMGRHFVPSNSRLVADALEELESLLWVMTCMRTGYIKPWSNHDRDRGLYGNSLDSYTDVLLHRTSLDDDELFEPTRDRYADALSEEA